MKTVSIESLKSQTVSVQMGRPQCQVPHYLQRGVVVELTNGSGNLLRCQGFVVTQVMHGGVPQMQTAPWGEGLHGVVVVC